jgi:RNA polymerase sigma-70 factor (ECF subfamily)
MNDSILIDKIKKGDMGAYEALVKKYMKKAYNVALYYTKNPTDAWDVSQQGFINAWKGIKRFNSDRPFFPWLYVIIKNEALTRFKKENREEGNKIRGLPLKNIDSPEESLEKKEKIRKLQKALLKLDKEKQEIIYLRHYACMSYKEISEVLGLPEGTIMSRLYYARKALLKEFMKDE